MYPSLATLTGDLFAEFEAIQRQIHGMLGLDDWPAAWGGGRGAFPAINMGTTDEAVEIYAFAPGLDPARIDVSVEKGLLAISGERETRARGERFAGSFRRVIALPDAVDTSRVEATYRNGVLRILIPKAAPKQLRRIEVKELEHKQ